MTRLRKISTAALAVAALGAGVAGAQSILSGPNSVHVYQSPPGSVVTGSASVVSRSLIPPRRPVLAYPQGYTEARHVEPVAVSHGFFSMPRVFWFFGPWQEPAPRIIPIEPEVIPHPAPGRMHAEPENRAVQMMDTILRRMDL